LRGYFLDLEDDELMGSPSVVLTKVRLLKDSGEADRAAKLMRNWMEAHPQSSEVMKAELIKLLIDLGLKDEALMYTIELLNNLNQSVTKHFCSQCGYNSDEIFWRCPQCHEWETIQFRWKVS